MNPQEQPINPEAQKLPPEANQNPQPFPAPQPNTTPDSTPLNQPSATPAIVPVIYGHSNGGLQPRKPLNKKIIYIMALLLTTIAATFLAIMIMLVIPNNNAQRFEEQSQKILENLSENISDLHDNNFAMAKQSTSDYNNARSLLLRHQADLSKTIDEVQRLKNDYEKAKTRQEKHRQSKKINDAFDLAGTITNEYKSSIQFRQSTFEAYGELPNELNKYIESYNKGGLRVDFIAQTKYIKELSQNALNKMNNLKVTDDDQALYRLRIDYLKNNQQTFARLNAYYRTNMDAKLNPELKSYSKNITAINVSVRKEISNYVDNSKTANDFKAFEQLIKT